MSQAMPQVSVVVPVHDEEGAAAALAREIADALQGRAFEMIFVDDASRDGTRAELEAARTALPQLRVLAHGANAGQSRAVRTGVLAARGEIILTLDGDGQNPPGDGPALIDLLLAAPAEVALVGGRRARRQDSQAKLWASRWANRIRKRLLGDDADDTGCGLKAFRREAFLRLPYFDHMHRYLPALMIREGYRNLYLDVSHRPRGQGRSKYTNWSRLKASVSDLLGVIWLKSRARRPGGITEL
ncbi:MAG: glycosyltransferase family 2 protein [Brevundimonas sp.]|uniref:glycosyltransferase family 2 protein n=1 Tax=Brevundimonas sp. TaxID=1871086 RepID=UPI00391FA2EF